jgi:hypothetical protein
LWAALQAKDDRISAVVKRLLLGHNGGIRKILIQVMMLNVPVRVPVADMRGIAWRELVISPNCVHIPAILCRPEAGSIRKHSSQRYPGRSVVLKERFAEPVAAIDAEVIDPKRFRDAEFVGDEESSR